MKINKLYLEIALAVILYLAAIYIWSLPFQKNSMPYGETDSGTHFTLGDYMAQTDKPVYNLPLYLATQYGDWNNNKIWYPPQFHVDVSIAQIAGGDRVMSAFLFYAIICSLIVLASYILFRNLFGVLIGFLSSFFIIFSTRDILWYLFGQYPQVASFVYMPVVLYSYYKYVDSFFSEKKKPIYLYITAILLSIQFFFHPQGVVASVLVIIIFSLFTIFKERKFIFDIKHFLVFLLIIAIVLGPFFSIPLGKESKFRKDLAIGSGEKSDAGFFYWTKTPKEPGVGYPGYYSYSAMNGIWTVPFVLLGIAFLLVSRKRKEMLLISWLIALYILFHEAIIGGRAERFIETEAYLFYPLVFIGILGFIGVIKMPDLYKRYAKAGFVALLLILVIFLNGKAVYSQLKGAYGNDLSRITSAQFNAAEFIGEKLPDDAQVYITGTLSFNKKKWIWALSHKSMAWQVVPVINTIDIKNCEPKCTHAFVDYSDLALAGAGKEINELQEWEKNNLADASLLYDKDNIRVYELGKI